MKEAKQQRFGASDWTSVWIVTFLRMSKVNQSWRQETQVLPLLDKL